MKLFPFFRGLLTRTGVLFANLGHVPRAQEHTAQILTGPRESHPMTRETSSPSKSGFPSCQQPHRYSVPWPEAGKWGQASPLSTAPLLQATLDGDCSPCTGTWHTWIRGGQEACPAPCPQNALRNCQPWEEPLLPCLPQDAIGYMPTLALLTLLSRLWTGTESSDILCRGRAERGSQVGPRHQGKVEQTVETHPQRPGVNKLDIHWKSRLHLEAQPRDEGFVLKQISRR